MEDQLNPSVEGLRLKEPPIPFLSFVLRTGVILCGSVISVGLLLFLLTGSGGYAVPPAVPAHENQYFIFHDPATATLYFPTTPFDIFQGVLQFKPFAIIMLGVLLLIATPVITVVLAALNFIKVKNWIFTFICIFILAVLTLSFFLGKAGG